METSRTSDFLVFLKGFAMGVANAIPGVSGGTVAFITGIYERLINAVKSFNLEALRKLSRFDMASLWRGLDLRFLLTLSAGAAVGIVTLAVILEKSFDEHPRLVWSAFFGLILASVPMVGKMVREWSGDRVVLFLVGAAVAVSMVFLKPAPESKDFLYLGLCGAVAMCSMIIPGLSGSFVLILMGNYMLIIAAVAALKNGDFSTLGSIFLPVASGALLGLILFSRFLGWLFRKHHDQAVSLVTGFVAGSLAVIWPWKDIVWRVLPNGDKKTEGYENWSLPDFSGKESWIALALMLAGALIVLAIERLKPASQQKNETAH